MVTDELVIELHYLGDLATFEHRLVFTRSRFMTNTWFGYEDHNFLAVMTRVPEAAERASG